MGWSLAKPNTTGVQTQCSRLRRAAEPLWVENWKQPTQKPWPQSVQEHRRTRRSSLLLWAASQPNGKPTRSSDPSAKLGNTVFWIQSYCSFGFTVIWTSTSFCFYSFFFLLLHCRKMRLWIAALQPVLRTAKRTGFLFCCSHKRNRLIACLRSPERPHLLPAIKTTNRLQT